MSENHRNPESFADLETLEKIVSVGQSLIVVHDLKALLQKIVETAGSILKADIIVLYEYQEETGDVLVPPVTWGKLLQGDILEDRGVQRPHHDSAVFQILQLRTAFFAASAQADWDRLLETDRSGSTEGFIGREGILSSAAVCLMADQERVGVLFVNFRSRHAFTPQEQKIIELFASQSAVAIQNARLMGREQRLREQADTLREVSIAISSAAELKDTAGRILDSVGQVVKYCKATMQSVQGDTRSLIAYRGFKEQEINQRLLRPISQDPLITRVIQGSKPVILSETRSDPDWEINPQTENVRSWAGVPLIYKKVTIGLLTLDHEQPGFYKPSMENLLIAFSHQAAIAVKNALLVENDQRRIQSLQILNDVAEIMASKIDTHDLLETILAQIKEKLDCTHCVIFFPHEVNGETWLTPDVIHSHQAEQIASRRFKPGEGFAGQVYLTGKSILTADAHHDPLFMPAREPRDLPRSMLVVPIKVGEQTIGVISADQDRYGWFDEGKRALVEALARQAGTAIQRNRGLELLQDISSRINSAQEVDEILEVIVSGAIQLTHMTSGVIYPVEDNQQLSGKRVIFPPDFDHPEPRMDRADGSTRRVIATKEILKFPDVRNDDHIHPDLKERIRSMIALPLIHDQKVVGVLFLNDRTLHNFTDTEITLLKSLANQAATAIYKTKLMKNLETQVRGHRALNEVGLELIGKQEENEILLAVARSAVRTMRCQHCSVFGVAGENIVVRATFGVREKELAVGRAFPLGQSVAGWAAQVGKPALVADVSLDGRFDPTWSSNPPKSLVAVPVLVDQKVYGVISAEQDRIAGFDEQDQLLLETLALQASQAIRMARRLHDLEALNSAGSIINSQLDIDQIFKILLETVDRTFQCLYSTLFILEPTDELVVKASTGPASRAVDRIRFKKGEGLVGWVAEHGESQIIADARFDDRFVPLQTAAPWEKPHSILLAPMRLQDKILGVIVADKDVADGFNSNDRIFMETLASQTAVAYDNARLYHELRLLHDINKQLITLDFDKLLPLLVEGAMQLTQTEHGIIYLLNEDGTRITRYYPPASEFAPSRLQLHEGGITRLIFEKGEPIAISNILEDPRVSEDVIRWGFKAFYAQPLKAGDQVIGVLYLNDDQVRQFTDHDQQLIATLATQAASAIQNTQYYQQRMRGAAARDRIVQIVGTIGTQTDSLVKILEELTSVFEIVNFGTFVFINFNTQAYDIHAVVENGRVLAGNEVPRERGGLYRLTKEVLDSVVQSGKLYRTGDTTSKAYQVRRPTTKSILTVPLWTSDGRVIGVLDLESDTKDAFSKEDETLCQDLANIASIAIEKDQLFTTMQRLNTQIEILHRAVKEESSEKVFNLILDGIIKLLGENTSACMALYEEETDRFFGYQAAGPMKDYLLGVPPRSARGTGRYVISSKEALYIDDVYNPPSGRPTVRQESIDRGVKSFAALPLKHRQEKILGLLFINLQKPFQFTDEIKRIIELYTIQAAIVIENSHIYEDSLMREAAIKRRENPYIAGEPIYDPQRFYGRHSIIRTILDGIHNNSFIIYGERRIGKTSLLLQLVHQLNINQDPLYSFLPIYASLQGIPESNFFNFLISQITRAAAIPREQIAAKPRRKYGFDDFEGVLEGVVRYREQQLNKTLRIVLMLDEMDVFTDYRPQIGDRFRSIFATWSGTHLKMVMAGVSIQRVAKARTSAWYNMFKEIELDPMDESEARQLIIQPVQKYYSYTPEALRLLLETSDRKPYEIQRLGYYSVNCMLERLHSGSLLEAKEAEFFKANIEEADVRGAIGMILEEDDSKYRDLWQMLDPLQQKLILETVEQGGLIPIHAARPDGKEIFTRKDLYNITRKEGLQAQYLTRLFTKWLRESRT